MVFNKMKVVLILNCCIYGCFYSNYVISVLDFLQIPIHNCTLDMVTGYIKSNQS